VIPQLIAFALILTCCIGLLREVRIAESHDDS
jgi:hypothetical protein